MDMVPRHDASSRSGGDPYRLLQREQCELLSRLEATGKSQSEATRSALVEAASKLSDTASLTVEKQARELDESRPCLGVRGAPWRHRGGQEGAESRVTYDLIHDDFVCERRGTIEMKGMGETETYFLLARRSGAPSDAPPAVRAAAH